MLKHRVMPTLLFKEVGLVKGVRYDSWRRVGAAMQAVKVYNLRQVDELVFLDIAATPGSNRPDFQQIDELADVCFMPMTVGGGIRSIDDMRDLLRVGADKVAVNTAAVESPGMPNVSNGMRFAPQTALFPASAAATPSMAPFPNNEGFLEVLLVSP